MPHCVLYYPTIEFRDFDWLWRASLLFDKIYRIVPESYRLDEPTNIQALCESGDIGIPLHPGNYAAEAGREFMDSIKSKHWDAAGLVFDADEVDTSLIHEEKCDQALRNMIIAQKGGGSVDGFLPVSKYFAATYMAFLARKMAEKNDLGVTTDSVYAYTASNYFQYDGKMDYFPPEDIEQVLGAILISDFLPQEVLHIPPSKIIQFRDRFVEERRNFLSSIETAASEIAKCHDPRVIADRIADVRQDVDRKTKELRSAMRYLGVREFCGWNVVTVPIATAVVPKLAQLAEANPDFDRFMVSVGVALGLYLGTAGLIAQKRELSRKSDYSYLVHAQNTFTPNPAGPLRSSFKEFLDD